MKYDKVEGSQVSYKAPPLGFLTVLTKFEIEIACPDGKNPFSQFVTVSGNSANDRADLLKRCCASFWARLGEPTAERGGRAKTYFRITAKGLREARHAQRTLMDLWGGVPQLDGGRA